MSHKHNNKNRNEELDCELDKNDFEDIKQDNECEQNCHIGEECACQEECESKHCDENCHCGEECHCDKDNESEQCKCGEDKECKCQSDKANEYLNLARQVQADFDNFRRHASEDIKKSFVDGQVSVIEVFLPCLDTFKEAKKSIEDEAVLKGVNMIEENIHNALEKLGVHKIDAVGKKYDPHLHNAIAVMRDEEKENDIILEEYQAGYTFNDKVIRYSIVSVNKKEG